MRILVSGSSGLIGRALCQELGRRGHSVGRLVRNRVTDPRSEIAWDPVSGNIDEEGLLRYEKVVNLAGRSIASGIWTGRQKRLLVESRVRSTRLLAESLARLRGSGPTTLLNASAIGYYGHRGDELLTEESPGGQGFFAELCREWENATLPAAETGIQVVRARFGLVFAPVGGFLEPLLPLFRLGLGAKIGNGSQWMSWIHIEDLIQLLCTLLEMDSAQGALNLVAPEPVTNSRFTETVASILNRPAWLSVPKFVLHLLPGGMGSEMFLASQRATPKRLEEMGIGFRFPELHSALEDCLADRAG